MSMLVNAHTPLDGYWGGDRANLTIDAKGAQIELDCAHGTFATPAKLDRNGRFSSDGVFVIYPPGPDRVDAPDPRRAANYSGKLTGSTLTLAVKVAGEPSPQRFRLQKNARVKLLRCL